MWYKKKKKLIVKKQKDKFIAGTKIK